VVLVREGVGNLVLGATPQEAAERLYAELHRLDADPSVERIVVALPPNTPEWTPIHDRLRRAAAALPSVSLP
jgi:L-threonylcarbamoyladenylate synthase